MKKYLTIFKYTWNIKFLNNLLKGNTFESEQYFLKSINKDTKNYKVYLYYGKIN